MRRAMIATAGLLAGAALLVVLVTTLAADPEPVPPAAGSPGRFPDIADGDSATVWAVGDGAGESTPARELGALIARSAPDVFLYLGDVYPEGTEEDFEVGYTPAYGRLREVTLPTPGNHEWPNRAEGYDPYWAEAIGGTPPYHYGNNRVAGWQLLSLNSEDGLDPGSAQLRWLDRQVSTGGNCRIAFWHRPRFSAGKHGDNSSVEPLWRLVRGRAALVLGGHDHDMQELEPVDGTVQLVAGAGGYGHYPVDESDPRLAWSNDRVDGALRLRLTPRHVRYEFVSAAGEILRSGSASCRPGSPPEGRR